MANLIDQKLSAGDFSGNNVAALADKPALTAAQLKARFDNVAQNIVTPKLNNVIDILLDDTALSSGAEQIGSAPISGVTGANIHAQMSDLKNQFDNVLLDPRVFPDGSVSAAKLATDAVETAKIKDGAVTSGKLASGLLAWANVADKPSTFTPSAHNQDASTINSGAFHADRIPTLDQSKVAGLAADIDTLEARAGAIEIRETCIAASGAPNFTATHAVAWTEYPLNKPFVVVFTQDVPVGSTLNIDGLGAKDIKIAGTANGDSFKIGFKWMIYDGTDFFAVSVGGIALPSTIAAGDTLLYEVHDQVYNASTTYGAISRTLTIKKAGTYRLKYNCYLTSSGTAYVKLQKNGVDVASSEITASVAINSASPPTLKTLDVAFAENDVITMLLKSTSGMPYNNFFSVSMLWADLATEIATIV